MSAANSLLTDSQIQSYLRDGILVVPLLSEDEVRDAQRGLVETLREEYGVDVRDLKGTGRGLVDASSTNGEGEQVLSVLYECSFRC